MTQEFSSKKNENLCPHKNSYMNVHSSIIHNSQKEETNQMSPNQLINRYIKALFRRS